MGDFYVVYKIRTTIPEAEVYSNSYEIFGSEKSFLIKLKNYLNFARDCMIDQDEEYFSDFPDEQENYDSYINLIEQRINSPYTDNILYENGFIGLDIEIEILFAANDCLGFFEILYEDYLAKFDISDIWELGSDERDEIFDEHPILKSLSMIDAPGEKPNEKNLIVMFKENQYMINETACMLEY